MAPTAEERTWLEGELGVLPEFGASSALDEEETSRIDFDEDVNQIFVIVDYPIEPGEDGRDGVHQYDTMPLSMVFMPQKGMFVTLSLFENVVTRDMAAGRIRGVDTRYRTRFLLTAPVRASPSSTWCICGVSTGFRRVPRSACTRPCATRNSVTDAQPGEIARVNFSTSLKSDEVTLNKIMQGRIIPLYEDDQDLLEDVLVEIHQAIEMCNIYSNTLSGTMDAFASVISNNLNIVMKVLSVITIVMAIPNIIFGFYGMNVGLPFDGVPIVGTWVFPTVLAAVCCLIAAWIFKRKGMWH